jgi:hypothetical protein
MSTYGIAGSNPLVDFTDDPEYLIQKFLKDNWSNLTSGIDVINIDFGYEPDANSTKGFIIKVEENFTDQYGLDLADRYTQFDMIYDIHIWERDTARYMTDRPGRKLYMLRKYIERFFIVNCNGMSSQGVKHMYLAGARNVREPERQDWHHAIVTIRTVTWKVNAS